MMSMNYAEVMILLQTGAIAALIVMGLGMAVRQIRPKLPSGTPQLALDALEILECTDKKGPASFVLLMIVVFAALYTRTLIEPSLKALRQAVRKQRW
jgi:hypothetical protein